jgi:hypothetical protein
MTPSLETSLLRLVEPPVLEQPTITKAIASKKTERNNFIFHHLLSMPLGNFMFLRTECAVGNEEVAFVTKNFSKTA